jgi:hypothetical protein
VNLLPGKGYVPATDRDDSGLELEDEPIFHRRMWRLQRAGWIAMQVIVLGGLLGLLGSGPLSRARLEHPAGLRVEHPRFARAEAPQAMRVWIPVPAPGGPTPRLALGRQFLDRVRIDRVEPPPSVTEARPDRLVYVFSEVGGAGPTAATVHFTPRGMGVVRAEISAPGHVPLTIRMVVYP